MANVKQRRYPVGAELRSGGVHFRVWAPGSKNVSVQLCECAEDIANSKWCEGLQPESDGDGYFSGLIPRCTAGLFYRFVLDAGTYPDPASRFQPLGPHGPSEIIDPFRFGWTDSNWPGLSREGQVIYELHVGTFTSEGTWTAALDHLPELAHFGITTIEVMPVADFAGKFGWGYDGVDLFAPTRLYGRPDDFRQFVDRAHALGLGVILDVVYNHLGPDGNYLKTFSPHYFHKARNTEWGEAINFDGDQCGPVREFFASNAAYWIDEFHLDGLRLDATQQIFDSSPDHIIGLIVRQARRAAGSRSIYVVAENEPQKGILARSPEQGGYGVDALWNDDFHHTAKVSLTGRREAYYSDYTGTPQEFISALKWGYLFQGQWYSWQKQPRGTLTFDLDPQQFVHYLESHDQVSNTLRGNRVHQITGPAELRALTGLLLLSPQTPMLFQGQEFSASTPFLYFADHHPELAKLVARGRGEFMEQFPSIACPESRPLLARPDAEQTFLRCKLDWSERERNSPVYALHSDLLALRRNDPVIRKRHGRDFDGAVLGTHSFLIRYFSREHGDRLLMVNLGQQTKLEPGPEPLLAPPEDREWKLIWSSEAPAYGGSGTPQLKRSEAWTLPARATLFLAATHVESDAKADSKT